MFTEWNTIQKQKKQQHEWISKHVKWKKPNKKKKCIVCDSTEVEHWNKQHNPQCKESLPLRMLTKEYKGFFWHHENILWMSLIG